MEIGMNFSILAQILPKPNRSNETYSSPAFRIYMCVFSFLSIIMLIIISSKADVVERGTSTLLKQGWQSVVFEEYTFRPEPLDDRRIRTSP